MSQSSGALNVAGMAGVAGGSIIVLAGAAIGPELGGMVSSYGLLIVLAAGYLLIALRVRGALLRRTAQTRTHSPTVDPSRT